MPYISGRAVRVLFDPDYKEESEGAVKLVRKNHGPGQFDAWSAIEGEDNCWVEREIPSSTRKKKKLILSNGIFAAGYPEQFELDLFARLVEEFEVYLWPGPDVPFSTATCPPVESATDLWEKISSLHSATEKDVKESLAHQHIATDDYIIVDHAAYGDVHQRWLKHKLPLEESYPGACRYLEKSTRHDLNLSKISPLTLPTLKSILHSVNPNIIKTISLYAPDPDVLDWTLKQFPNLEGIEIIKPDTMWCNAHLEKLKGLHVTLTQPIQLRQLKLPADLFKSLTLDEAEDLSSLELEKSNHEMGICLIKCSKLKADQLKGIKKITAIKSLDSARQIQALIKENITVERNPVVRTNPNISPERAFDAKEVSFFQESPLINCSSAIVGYRFTRDKKYLSEHKLEYNPKIKHLVFSRLNLADLDLKLFPNLEELEIKRCTTGDLTLDLKDFKQLRNLKIDDTTGSIKIVQLPPALETLTIGKEVSAHLDLTQAVHLKKLELDLTYNPLIDSKDSPTTLNLESCKKLQEVTLTGVTIPTRKIKMNHLKNLKSVEIHCKINRKLFADFEVELENSNLHSLTLSQYGKLDGHFFSKAKVSLTGCNHLRDLIIGGGDAKLELEGIEKITSLRHAHIAHGGHPIQSIPATCPVFLEHIKPIYDAKVPDDRARIQAEQKLDRNQREINFANNNSPISFMHLIGDTRPDSETGEPKPYDASLFKNPIISYIKSQERIPKNNYRFAIQDKIHLAGKEISFSSSLDEKTDLYPVKKIFQTEKQITDQWFHEVDSNPNLAYGYFSCQIDPDKFYPLTTDFPLKDKDAKFEIHCNPKDAVTLFWHEEHKLYYIKAKSSPLHFFSNPKIEIQYIYKKDKTLDASSILDKKTKKNTDLLPAELIEGLRRLINHHDKLKFLHDDLMPNSEKLKQLIQYCKDFKEITPLDSLKSSLDNLLDNINEGKGVCRHRSEAFMVLARYIGIPARVVRNGIHVFCEIPYQRSWEQIDLGGGFRIDKTPLHLSDQVLKNIARPVIISSDAKSSKEVKPSDTAVKNFRYKKILDNLLVKSEEKSIQSLLEKMKSPLITLKPGQTSANVRAQTIKELAESKHPPDYLYIQSPRDFRYYLTPPCIKDNQTITTEGPLSKIIKNGGILLGDWGQFTPTEIVAFQSILDAKPTLLDRKMSEKVRVIGLKTPASETCEAFESRCQPVSLHQDFFEVKKGDDKKQEAKETYSLDLFQQPTWKDSLLGDIIFDGHSISLKPSQFVEELKKNIPINITLYNPPNDPNFNILLDQIKLERRFLFNGEWISVHPGVKIQTATRKHASTLPNVTVKKAEDTKAELIYVGAHNIHECINKLLIDKSSFSAKTAPGFLHDYQEKRHAFYIVNYIAKSDWEKLLNIIETTYKDKSFTFLVAPGAQIEGVLQNNIPPMKPNATSPILISNDPDFTALQTESKDPLLIEVNAQTHLSDLLTEIKIVKDPTEPAKKLFQLIEKDMLRALKSGRQIILKGNPPPELFSSLSSLLSENPFIYVNGERIACRPSQVKLILPNQALTTLPITHHQKVEHTAKDYLNAFPGEEDRIALIKQFFEFANRLPHRMTGYPDKPVLNHARLQRMLYALKHSRLHPQNPTKGLLLYDYPKNSEHYAYLNVVGKTLLASHNRKPLRKAKLEAYFKKNHITQDNFQNHLWRLLNYFSGADLKTILGDLTKIPPLKLLWERIQSIIKGQKQKDLIPDEKLDAKEQPSHVSKRSDQLKTLIQDPNSRLIILKGDPGVGKTFTIKTLKDVKYHEGETNIEAWLNDKSPETKILLLDEANMAKPGTWDFLKGLFRKDKLVYYNGKEYHLSDKHKVIATGNPEHFPGRHFHPFFQEYGEVIYFKMPDDHYLEKNIIQPLLDDDFKKYSGQLLRAYHLIQSYNPTILYSTRDLESLTSRFNILAKTTRSPDESLLKACIGEYAGALPTPEKRKQFIRELSDKFDLALPKDSSRELLLEIETESKTYYIPKEIDHIKQGIEQALSIRDHTLKHPDKKSCHKKGILIEGPAGLGKSTTYRILLEKFGLSEEAADPKMRFYEMNANPNDKSIKQQLLKAFNEGSVVILNELNLDPSLELLLNDLLTSSKNPGFMVFASQNPSHQKGRHSVSQALSNRMNVNYMEPYSEPTLKAIAAKNGVHHPDELVADFVSRKATMRTYYQAVTEAAQFDLASMPKVKQSVFRIVDDYFPAAPRIPPHDQSSGYKR